MRPLDELGISKTPWIRKETGPDTKHVSIVFDNEYGCVAVSIDENARLIAAAPKLYEALRQLVDYLSLNNWTDRELDPFIEAAVAALAVASGESEEGETK